MGKHTPGPWSIDRYLGYGELNGVSIRGADFYVLAVAIGDLPELDAQANARLIAAAPDMFATLQRLLSDHDGETTPRSDREIVADISAAIAKATGAALAAQAEQLGVEP